MKKHKLKLNSVDYQQKLQEFADHFNSDPDFNYSRNEFNEWLADQYGYDHKLEK